ncbi:MAG: ACT domain-containing protein, partial [Gammaproteobacteria bacterium]|nr:ACT domain-containing protein [Gammaproteobacteria bacterium]
GDKTSVLVSARNRPGSLAALLRILADRGVSLTRIESRPARIVNWEYVFFLDIEGHCEDELLGRALAELDAGAGLYKLLGSYPCAPA